MICWTGEYDEDTGEQVYACECGEVYIGNRNVPLYCKDCGTHMNVRKGEE